MHHDHFEVATNAASSAKGINAMLGTTVLGNIISSVIGITIYILSDIDLSVKHVSEVAEFFFNWIIKIGSLLVITFGVINGRIAYIKNKADLKKLQESQKEEKKPTSAKPTFE
jgi:hypothetical protein